MARTGSRSQQKSGEFDATYTVAMPFEGRDAHIHLIEGDEDRVEVIVSQVPIPGHYHTDYNYPKQLKDENKMRANAVAKWILKDAARHLDKYDWEESSSKSNNPNLYLRDVYFTCRTGEVDDAVMDAKKFLTSLEEKVLHQNRKFGIDLRNPPSEVVGSTE